MGNIILLALAAAVYPSLLAGVIVLLPGHELAALVDLGAEDETRPRPDLHRAEAI